LLLSLAPFLLPSLHQLRSATTYNVTNLLQLMLIPIQSFAMLQIPHFVNHSYPEQFMDLMPQPPHQPPHSPMMNYYSTETHGSPPPPSSLYSVYFSFRVFWPLLISLHPLFSMENCCFLKQVSVLHSMRSYVF
jgi:hypothetical protein